MLTRIILARYLWRDQKTGFLRELLPLLAPFAGAIEHFFVRLAGRFGFFLRRSVVGFRKQEHFIQKPLRNEFPRNPGFQIQAIPPYPFGKNEARYQQGSRRNVIVGCASADVEHLAYRLAMRSSLPEPIGLVVGNFGKCAGIQDCFLFQRWQPQPLTRLRGLRRERLIGNHLPV